MYCQMMVTLYLYESDYPSLIPPLEWMEPVETPLVSHLAALMMVFGYALAIAVVVVLLPRLYLSLYLKKLHSLPLTVAWKKQHVQELPPHHSPSGMHRLDE